MYVAVVEKDTVFGKKKIPPDYRNQILGNNKKYLGKYIAKCEVVAGSPHSFQCWKTPRNSFFDGAKAATQSNTTAFDFLYGYQRNPLPSELTVDVKTWLTPLRNYYTLRGNSFYYIEVGKNPSDIIQVKVDYPNNTVTIKEGNNFRINLISDNFKGNNANEKTINVVETTKKYQVKIVKNTNYIMRNFILFCDPNFGFDSYIDIGKIN